MQKKDFVHRVYGLFEQMLLATAFDTTRVLSQDVVAWVSQSQKELLVIIGSIAKDSHDKLIHKCLVQGGVSYIRDQYVITNHLLMKATQLDGQCSTHMCRCFDRYLFAGTCYTPTST